MSKHIFKLAKNGTGWGANTNSVGLFVMFSYVF